ncbi:MAG: ABC transporter ATP-binding protein [Rhizobacter sp.]|nr:ABC transporter ATP-binding protein [Chlorobiales bacterium]
MLEAIDLTKMYNGAVALQPLNLRINAGEIFCLLGSNGAGKTTTINLFLGFTAPSGGTAKIGGLDVVAHPVATKKFIAYIPETVMLYKNLTGLENLEYFSSLSGHDYSPPQLTSFLQQTGLTEADAMKRIGTYSKGMRQKVGIAIAMAKDAKALLLDEPTSGLDPKAAFEFSELLKSLCAKGVAILMATHDLFRAKEISTAIGVMKQGRLVAQVRSDELGHTDLEKLYLSYMK